MEEKIKPIDCQLEFGISCFSLPTGSQGGSFWTNPVDLNIFCYLPRWSRVWRCQCYGSRDPSDSYLDMLRPMWGLASLPTVYCFFSYCSPVAMHYGQDLIFRGGMLTQKFFRVTAPLIDRYYSNWLYQKILKERRYLPRLIGKWPQGLRCWDMWSWKWRDYHRTNQVGFDYSHILGCDTRRVLTDLYSRWESGQI